MSLRRPATGVHDNVHGSEDPSATLFSWKLKSVAPSDLHDLFLVLRKELALEFSDLSRPLNGNAVIVDYSSDTLDLVQERAQEVAQCLPGRIFLVALHPALKDIGEFSQSGVYAGCCVHRIESEKALLSEVVLLNGSAFSAPALSSILRAHYHVGFPPALFLFGTPDQNKILSLVLSEASTVLFSCDSLRGEEGVALLDSFLGFGGECYDIDWIRLSSWRTELRNLSLRYSLQDRSSSIQEIVIHGGSPFGGKNGEGSSSFLPQCLFVGWLLLQLESELSAFTANGVECTTFDGHRWFLRYNVGNAIDNTGGMSEITMVFGVPENLEVLQVCLDAPHSRFHSTFTSAGNIFRSTGQFRSLTRKEALWRFYHRGESVTHYQESFRRGLEFLARESDCSRVFSGQEL
jgi:hypothetical protein